MRTRKIFETKYWQALSGSLVRTTSVSRFGSAAQDCTTTGFDQYAEHLFDVRGVSAVYAEAYIRSAETNTSTGKLELEVNQSANG